jgi:apolipoprotein N-acyltransferase
MLLTGLLLALLMALLLGLRGCEGIALQWGSLPLAAPREPSVQPAVVEPNVRESVDSLADARQREYQLRQQLAQLQATWLQQQRACRRR